MTRTAISPRLAMRTFFSTLRLSDRTVAGGGAPPRGGYNTVTARRVSAMPGDPLHRRPAVRDHRLDQPLPARRGPGRCPRGGGGGGRPPDGRPRPAGPELDGAARGPTSWRRSCCGPPRRPSGGSWPWPRWPLAAAGCGDARDRHRPRASSGRTTWWPPTGARWPGCWPRPTWTPSSATPRLKAPARPSWSASGSTCNWPDRRTTDRDRRDWCRRAAAPSLRQLSGRPVDRARLLAALLGHLGRGSTELDDPPGRARWRADLPRRCTTARQPRSGSSSPTAPSRGRPPASPTTGHLVVVTADGPETVVAGDVVHLRERRRVAAPEGLEGGAGLTSAGHATARDRWRRLHRLQLRPLLGESSPRRPRGRLRRADLRRQPAQPGRRRGPDRLRPGGHRRPGDGGQDARRATRSTSSSTSPPSRTTAWPCSTRAASSAPT